MLHKSLTCTAALICFTGAPSAWAATILNQGFESGTGNYDIVVTGVNTNGAGTSAHGSAGLSAYENGLFSELGSNRLFLNVQDDRSYQVRASVFEDDETTNTLVSDLEYTFTAALGDRDGSAPTNFRDSSDIELHIGYLTTADDISTFVSLASNRIEAATINALNAGDESVGTYADFSVSTTVQSGNAAIGNQLAIQLIADWDAQSPDDRLQSSVDNLRISIVPEPSSLALIGLGGLCLLRRRRA